MTNEIKPEVNSETETDNTIPSLDPAKLETIINDAVSNALKTKQDEIDKLKIEIQNKKSEVGDKKPEVGDNTDIIKTRSDIALEAERIATKKLQEQNNTDTNTNEDNFYKKLTFEEKMSLSLESYNNVLQTRPYINDNGEPDLEFQKLMNEKGYLDEGAEIVNKTKKAMFELAQKNPQLVDNSTGKLNKEGQMRIRNQFEELNRNYNNKIFDSYDKFNQLRRRNIKKITKDDI